MKKRKLIRDNSNEVVRIIFNYFGIKYDRFAKHIYHNHPLYPSIKSVAFILARYGIDSSLILTDDDEIPSLPFPLIINYDGLLLPVSRVSKDSVVILNENCIEEDSKVNFLKDKWDSYALVLNKDGKFRKPSLSEKLGFIFPIVSIAYLSLLLLFLFGIVILHKSIHFLWIDYCYYFSVFIGLCLSVLFHVQKLNPKNVFINKLCNPMSNNRGNCSSILNSSAATVFGLLSWIDIGSIFFLSCLFVLIVFVPHDARALLAYLSVCASLFIPYSIIYQAKIAKQFCFLCLLTQGVLLFNLIISIIALSNKTIVSISGFSILCSVFAILFIFSLYYLFSRTIYKYIENKRDANTLQSIKHSHSGLDYLLSNEDYDIDSAKPVVVYGGADGNTITLVINPLCNPCARKIRNLIPIIQSKRYTNLQVIFLTNLSSTREMSIATSLISSIMKGRRDDFKDYFDHYPAIHQHDYSFCLQDYMHLLQNQTEWCFAHGFTSTPLVFFNGKLLPSMYSVEDIDFITE